MLPPRSSLALLLASLSCAAPPPPRSPAAPPASPPAASASVATPPAPPADPLAAKIDPIFADFTKPGSPGCAVGVYRAGEILFARGYGLANLEHAAPIDRDTPFGLASMAKQFTAMAVLLLVKDGKVSMDDDVRKYVPELPVYGKPITLAHLMHHTSGLRDYSTIFGLQGGDAGDVTNNDDALFTLAQQKGLNFPTGSKYDYSNSGYVLLGTVVERVTGKPLSVFAKERIFDPLGMKSTRYLDFYWQLVPHRATGYGANDHDGFYDATAHNQQTGPGGVVTTVADLARWDANFYDPKVGDRATLSLLRTPGKLDDGTPIVYAGGLEERVTNGIPREEHDGEFGGFSTDLLRFPTERLSVACLCNFGNVDPTELADSVAKALLPKLSAPPPSAAPAPKRYRASSAELAPIVGAYYDPVLYDVRTFALKDGAPVLGLQLAADGLSRKLDPLDARTFLVEAGAAIAATTYRFAPATAKTPALLVRTPAGEQPTTFERFEPITLGAGALAEYTGRYASDEVGHDALVVVEDGKLRLGAWGRSMGRPPLDPLVRDVFIGGGLALRFERDARGHVRGFVLNTARATGLRWVRHDAPKVAASMKEK